MNNHSVKFRDCLLMAILLLCRIAIGNLPVCSTTCGGGGPCPCVGDMPSSENGLGGGKSWWPFAFWRTNGNLGRGIPRTFFPMPDLAASIDVTRNKDAVYSLNVMESTGIVDSQEILTEIMTVGSLDIVSSTWNIKGIASFREFGVSKGKNGNVAKTLFGGSTSAPGAGSASIGSFHFSVNFGQAANEELELGGQFSVHAVAPSPLLPTRQYLQYRNWLLDRILQTEVATADASSILGTDWEDRLDTLHVYGRVTTDDTLPQGVTHQVRILQERREPVIFRFTANDPVGPGEGEGIRRKWGHPHSDGPEYKL